MSLFFRVHYNYCVCRFVAIVIFYPLAIETVGAWNHLVIDFVQEIDRRAILITDEPRESTFLFSSCDIAPER